MSLIIKSGFQAINTNIFRKESLAKGEGLLKSNHVSQVAELGDPEKNKLIVGVVLRETPGAESKKMNTNFYNVKVELNSDRSIRETHCDCKAGKGFCKHAAALCIFVNSENSSSKTDQPMLWNKPSDNQLAKYSKGCTIDVLYPPKTIIPGLYQVYKFEDIENLTDKNFKENSNMSRVMKSELTCITKKDERQALIHEEEEEAKDVIKQLLDLHKKSCFPIHYNYKVLEDHPEDCNKIKLKIKYKLNTDVNNAFSLIIVDEKKCSEICFLSRSQSSCSLWFRERFIRVTCSSRAHRIKTRMDESEESFMNLSRKFLNEKHQGSLTKEMLYGKEMEKEAKFFFEEFTGLKVYEIGLFISIKQPFLACSPDGIIINNNNCELLEIKCPATCKNSKIIDKENRQSIVPYLFYTENGDLMLKKSSVYYTQIQMSMYILCISACHFFVYSTVDHVHIKVLRDEEFLSNTVPKIEKFYYEYLFPKLVKS